MTCRGPTSVSRGRWGNESQPTLTATAAALREHGLLEPLDLHFARYLLRLVPEQPPAVELAAALASRQVHNGHVCLDLARLLAQPPGDGQTAFAWPELEAWLRQLHQSPLVGMPSGLAPLILVETRLYLARYFDFEASLAKSIRARVQKRSAPLDSAWQQAALRRLFGPETGADDPQYMAAATAANLSLCVITGGPGTGKTSTMVRVLALLIESELARTGRAPRVMLMAPTGKAAARMDQAVRQAQGSLQVEAAVQRAMLTQASTIHRALGASARQRTRFSHTRDNPLSADIVVVDEASMVDVALMARLLEAVPEQARVVLLGDRHQLASVEAGAVLGDICGVGQAPRHSDSRGPPRNNGERGSRSKSPLAEHIVELTRSYRYGAHSGIARLANAIREGRADGALSLLTDASVDEVELTQPPAAFELSPQLTREIVAGYEPVLRPQADEKRLDRLALFRVLSAHRKGGHGAVALNAATERLLRRRGLIPGAALHYPGRPLLITSNDYTTRLFNGDVGVVVTDSDYGLRVLFEHPQGALRRFAPARLPSHEPVFAMTVHKSQGSEFDHVAVVLPPDPSPVLSRELLYTAVTRARKRVSVHASREALVHAIRTPVERASGLGPALWS